MRRPTNNIGPQIAKMRQDCDLSQERLAGILGVSTGTVSRWERGEIRPSITRMIAICKACGGMLVLNAKDG